MSRTSPIVKKKTSASFTEMGQTGLSHFGGYINEEKLSRLSAGKAAKVFSEMADNDPTIGAFLFAMESLLQNVDWKIEPADQTRKSKKAAEFLESCLYDMEHSWNDFICEVLSMLTFGWSSHEIVYKIRGGADTEDRSYYSKFNDGMIGWRKLPVRSQDTLRNFIFDKDNEIESLVQELLTAPYTATIPIKKLIMFRTKSRKNNPMGRSILRNAYRPWAFKKRIEEIEGIGIERDLAGLPVAYVPSNILSSTANAEEKATLSAITDLVTNIRRDHQEGVVFPRVYDENSNSLYELELLSTGGTRQFDTSQIIDRYDKRIAMTVLADFLFLGQSRVGSFALSSDKTDLFGSAIGSFLSNIAETLNRQPVPRLMKINAIAPENWPIIKPGDIEKPDLQRFTDAVYKLVGVGALVPSESLNAKLSELLEVEVDSSTIKVGINDNHKPTSKPKSDEKETEETDDGN